METLLPSWLMDQNRCTKWTKEENKKFESALAIFDEQTPNRWFKVAALVPGKSVHDVINQYRELVADVSDIEAGLVPIPGYLTSSFTLELVENHGFATLRKRGKSRDQERRRGVPWTEEEHRRFLMGLEKHGKGDWRNISRNFVISKTPTQVASHAQKYYLRQLSGGKDKRRPSIHDITTLNLSSDYHQDHMIRTNIKSSSDLQTSKSLLKSTTKPAAAAKLFVNFNTLNNAAALMALGSAIPYDVASLIGHYGSDASAANSGFHNIQATTYQIHG